MAKAKKIIIAVSGAGKCEGKLKKQAYEVGEAIAKAGAILITGGLGGTMEAASRGARDAGGMTVGVIPGTDNAEANQYCDIVIPTGIGEARNAVLINAADAVISLHGRYGTISEMCFALKQNKPLVSLVEWNVLPEVETISDPKKAVKQVIKLVKNARK